jgi:hypothetical protein
MKNGLAVELVCKEVLSYVHNEWVNLVDIASIQGLNLILVQHKSRALT